MKRRTMAIVIGVLLLVGLGAVGVVRVVALRNGPSATLLAAKPSTCADAYRVLKLSPSEVTNASSVCLNQTLQLSGEIVGAVGQAYTVDANTTAPTQMCTPPKRWSSFPPAFLGLAVGGKGYRLRIAAPGSSEHQAVTLSSVAGVVELASISDPTQAWSRATGTLMLNADGTTGNLDVSLLRDVSGAAPVHLSGQWACGAPSALPSLDASIPCASFYALNHLTDADVARMKASACNPQRLAFSGDLTAQLDHAITDIAISPHSGIDGDNYCGTVGEEYTAAIKFSVGDESFLLDLNAHRYPAVSPGQYPAGSGLSSAGATLWLGRADPDRQGQFMVDYDVFWSATSGTFTINPDMKSGTIDATLNGLLDHSGSIVQIKGSWRCAI